MKGILFFGVLVAFLAACSTRTEVVVKKVDGGVVLNFSADSKYLLMPMEDAASEKRMDIKVENDHFNSFVIRPALNQIDYWIPLELTELKNQNIELYFENLDGYDLFLKGVKLSDSFEYDYAEKWRPVYHFTPPYGWMNDPNGMVYYDGLFHLKYQYNPYGTKWQNMSWGHAVSTDLVNWEHRPVAFYPDTLGAIFSGGSVQDVNNATGLQKGSETTLLAYFTHANPYSQIQSLGYSNDAGNTWHKYAGNPILTHFDNDPDFRDPKVFWHEETERFIMVIALSLQKVMEIYSSENGIDWEFESRFGDDQGAQDGIWECPDLFEMEVEGEAGNSKWVLICNLNPGGPSGGSAAQYFIGDFDGSVFKNDAAPEDIKWMDWGRDHYATVTWANVPETDGRRLAIGWMSNWQYANYVPTKNFRSAMTVVRELKLQRRADSSLVLSSYPVEELTKLRGTEVSYDDITINSDYVIDDFLPTNNGAYEITMNIKPNSTGVVGFTLFNSVGESVDISINISSGSLYMDRTSSGVVDFNADFPGKTHADILKKSEYSLRLLVDKSSIELFEGNGETVMTNIIFPNEPYNRIRFYTKGGESVIKGLNFYKLD